MKYIQSIIFACEQRSILKEFEARPQREVCGEHFFWEQFLNRSVRGVSSGTGTHPIPLAEFIEDPNDSSRLKRCLIALCQGPRAPHKQNLLNWALCLFSLGFVKKKFCDIPIQNSIEMYTDAQYEPGTVANYLRILFAVFSRRGVPYSQTKDFRQG